MVGDEGEEVVCCQLGVASVVEAKPYLVARKTIQAQLASLTTAPSPTERNDPGLLDRLPILDDDLSDLPEDLERDLWATFHLQVRYHHPTRTATIRVTIDEHTVHQLAAVGQVSASAARRTP
jgi:hypothetical protein